MQSPSLLLHRAERARAAQKMIAGRRPRSGFRVNMTRVPHNQDPDSKRNSMATPVNQLSVRDSSNHAPVRVMIADDHAIFRAALKRLLEFAPGFQVAGELGGNGEVVSAARQLEPDLLLLDDTHGHRTLDAVREVSRLAHPCRTILLTVQIREQQFVQAFRAGARGIMAKASPVDVMFKGIDAVMAGEYWVGRERVADLVRVLRSEPADPPRDRPFGLTSRELQVVEAVIAGYTNKEIAARLTISQNTAKHHLSSIFDKLGVSNRLELALFTHSHRILTPDAQAAILTSDAQPAPLY
jgi:DNA-binding NarL/FixJ family response regulator